MTPSRGRAGVASGDALLVLAVAALLVAAAYPRWERGAMDKRANAAAAAVDAVLAAAERFRQEEGTWPPGALAGTLPEGLTPYLPLDFSFQGDGYTLRWDRWTMVEGPPPMEIQEDDPSFETSRTAPPAPDTTLVPEPILIPLGGIMVRCDDDRVLARLQERFSPEGSFVRSDSWTLVVAGARSPR